MHPLDHIHQPPDIPSRTLKRPSQVEKRCKIKQTVHGLLLIRRQVRRVAVQHLPHAGHARGAHKVGPKGLADVLDRVDPQEIDGKVGYEGGYPVVEGTDDAWGFGVEVGDFGA